jgi:hypothetical protein
MNKILLALVLSALAIIGLIIWVLRDHSKVGREIDEDRDSRPPGQK